MEGVTGQLLLMGLVAGGAGGESRTPAPLSASASACRLRWCRSCGTGSTAGRCSSVPWPAATA